MAAVNTPEFSLHLNWWSANETCMCLWFLIPPHILLTFPQQVHLSQPRKDLWVHGEVKEKEKKNNDNK